MVSLCENSRGRVARASRFFQWFLSCAAHSLYTEWRESTPHTQTLLPNTRLARPACDTMATFSLRVLSACYCCLPLGVGSKASGWERGRQGRRRRHQGRRCRGVCPYVCAWGALHAADQAGRWGGIGRRRRRQGQGQWRCPGMVATAASGMQPARRGGRWARPLRAARVRTTKQLWMQPW